MTVRIGTGVSTAADPAAGAIDASGRAAAGLGGEIADLCAVFACGAHLADPQATLAAVREVLSPAELIGCGAGGVLGSGHEHERGTAVAVWAASFGGAGAATSFHAHAAQDEGVAHLDGIGELGDARAAILLADPYTFPTDALLELAAAEAPGVPLLGGLASGAAPEGGAVLFIGDEVVREGAVGALLEGVEVLPCVSQGAAPFGREVTITAAEGNIIHELAGAPALTTIQRIVGELGPRERTLLAGGLMIGIVIDGGKPDYQQGDFLVRPVLGADRETGHVAVGSAVRPGQVVRLHARDAESADADLRRELALRAAALGDAPAAGALVFSCNGRGQAMFGVEDHDALAVDRALGGAPAAGFFAAGEIGPVGGRSFLHGFTATVAVFPA